MVGLLHGLLISFECLARRKLRDHGRYDAYQFDLQQKDDPPHRSLDDGYSIIFMDVGNTAASSRELLREQRIGRLYC